MRSWSVLALMLCLSATGVFAQTGRYINDKRTGCQVWSDPYEPTDSVTWDGGCRDGFANGNGTLKWYTEGKVSATYTGAMQNGKVSGPGTYSLPGYGLLEGNFINGLLEGQGRIALEHGGVLAGNFRHGDLLDLDENYLQRLQKVNLPCRDTAHIYSEETDSLFYYALPPASKPRAALVLLPASGDRTEYVISSNKQLMQMAADSNILCLVPAINQNKDLSIDETALSFMDLFLADAARRYGIPPGSFILCGLSLGGNNALLYTELSRNPAFHTAQRPLAVIGIDPPVDYEDLYHNAAEEVKRYEGVANLSPAIALALKEDQFLVHYFIELYGGTPEEVPSVYQKGSQFSRRLSDGGNAKFLVHVPVRLYNDPDILWNLRVKGRDYYHMNAANHSAMILFLQREGNKKAELIPATGKGYRLDGSRHPHSWSLIDPGECISWIIQLLH